MTWDLAVLNVECVGGNCEEANDHKPRKRQDEFENRWLLITEHK